MSKRILPICDSSYVSHSSRQRSPLEKSSDNFPRKKKSRWSAAAENERTFIPGMPTQLPPNLSTQQEKIYILQLQIEDVSRRLKCGELGIPKNPEDRSPSPEPIYSSDGKRLNTREYRTRKKLEDERHNLVQQLTELNPEYKPPSDYKPPQNRITDKVFIPQENHPDINFVGLLIGPRGNTLKSLEKETGAKIIIRGKGSVKEGKIGRRDGLPMPGEDEPLHAFISAPVAEAVHKASKKINDIIRQGIEIPESQNDLRRAQLRELALLNGTLREHEGLMKLRAMAEAQTIATNKIQCALCGGLGHLSSDCKVNLGAYADQMNTNPSEMAKMDSEYSALMAELGVGVGQPLPPGFGRSRVQSRLPRQPPPPGVAPTDDDDDNASDAFSHGVNGGSKPVVKPAIGGDVAPPAVTSQQFPQGLPPPPPLPGGHYPVMHGQWSSPMMMAPVSGYPAALPATGTGMYHAPSGSVGMSSWPNTSPVQSSWRDASSQPVMSYGGMVPPYMNNAAGYWGGYPQVAHNPPPPPPPGV